MKNTSDNTPVKNVEHTLKSALKEFDGRLDQLEHVLNKTKVLKNSFLTPEPLEDDNDRKVVYGEYSIVDKYYGLIDRLVMITDAINTEVHQISNILGED